MNLLSQVLLNAYACQCPKKRFSFANKADFWALIQNIVILKLVLGPFLSVTER